MGCGSEVLGDAVVIIQEMEKNKYDRGEKRVRRQ